MSIFNWFWKSKNVSKDTVDEVVSELSREINYLSLHKLPSADGRDAKKVLARIQDLREQRDSLKKKYDKNGRMVDKLENMPADMPHPEDEETLDATAIKSSVPIFEVETRGDGMYYVVDWSMGRKNIVNAFRTENEANNMARQLNETSSKSQTTKSAVLPDELKRAKELKRRGISYDDAISTLSEEFGMSEKDAEDAVQEAYSKSQVTKKMIVSNLDSFISKQETSKNSAISHLDSFLEKHGK